MIKYEYIIDAQNTLVEHWGEDGKKVVEACFRTTPLNIPFSTFLKSCSACGGNWGGMLLTGIKKLCPEVYDAIPNDMGAFAWGCLCNTLLLCGVDTTSD